MDKLEEHIRKNREELDRYSPSKSVWKKLDKQLNPERRDLTKWLAVAAMIIAILGTAVLLLRHGVRQIDSQTADNTQLRESEIYYNNLVNTLYREAKPMLTANPEIAKELNSDISQIDSICSDIKKDLKDNVANQKVVEALIQNYRIKITLLEDMLTLLKEEKNNPKKTKNYEL